jgi:hypothetical protein
MKNRMKDLRALENHIYRISVKQAKNNRHDD